jgi:hypothetical protein
VSPLITLQPTDRFYEIPYEGYTIEIDFDPIFFILHLQPFKNDVFRLLKWMQNLHQSTWDHEILYADRFSKDEQLLVRPFLWKIKNTNVEGGIRLQFMFCLMETIHEPMHSDKLSLAQ